MRATCPLFLAILAGCSTNSATTPPVSALIQTSVATPNLVNGSFDFTGTYNPPGYTNPPTGWSVSGIPVDSGGEDVGAAPFDAGGFWDNGTIPGQGTSGSVAFIQRSGSISQMLSGLVPGHTYQIKYYENARDYLSSEDQEPLVTAFVGQSTIVPQHSVYAVQSDNPWKLQTGTFTATAPDELLTLEAQPSQSGADTTALFAQMSISLTTGPSQTIASAGNTAPSPNATPPSTNTSDNVQTGTSSQPPPSKVASSAQAEAATTQQGGTCSYPFGLSIRTISQEAVVLRDGEEISNFWGKPMLGGPEKTKQAIAMLEQQLRPGGVAEALNATMPLPSYATASAFFQRPEGEGLFLFGNNGCATEVAIVNPLGLFTTTPEHYFLAPSQFITP